MDSEPRVLTSDIRAILRKAVRPEDPDYGDAVQTLAERAGTSTRTLYRILGQDYADRMPLDLADRIALAAGGHLATCRIELASGQVVDYVGA